MLAAHRLSHEGACQETTQGSIITNHKPEATLQNPAGSIVKLSHLKTSLFTITPTHQGTAAGAAPARSGYGAATGSYRSSSFKYKPSVSSALLLNALKCTFCIYLEEFL